MKSNEKYQGNLADVRNNLLNEAKKLLPLTYSLQNPKLENETFWSILVDKSGNVESDGYAKESGVYIGKSIDDLSLSDLALLVDNKLDIINE